jgi:hypothetical protein
MGGNFFLMCPATSPTQNWSGVSLQPQLPYINNLAKLSPLSIREAAPS